MRMWMDLDELWGEIWGNVYPQFVHPQSTGGVDKILAEKSQHRSPARESRGTAFLWSVQVKPGRARRLEILFLNPGVRPGIQFTCRSYLYNIETGSKLGVKKPIQQVGFYERASRAGESCSLRRALKIKFWLIPAFGLESKRGFRTLRSPTRFHLVWPACAAGSRRASGPDPFSPAGGIGAVLIYRF